MILSIKPKLALIEVSQDNDAGCDFKHIVLCVEQVEYNSITKDEEPESPAAAAGEIGEDVVLAEWDEVHRIRSDEVLTLEKAYCQQKLQETKGTDAETEWECRLEEVDNAQTILGSNIEAGIITPETYAQTIKAAMKRDMTLAKWVFAVDPSTSFICPQRAIRRSKYAGSCCTLTLTFSCRMMKEKGKIAEASRLLSWARAMQTELKVLKYYTNNFVTKHVCH